MEYKNVVEIAQLWGISERTVRNYCAEGRIDGAKLIMLKEYLHNNIVPFIISADLKLFYYQGLKNWEQERRWLTDTIPTAQDRFKAYLDYFGIRR